MKVLSIIVAALLAVSLSAQAKHIELSSKNMVAIQGEIDDKTVADAQLQLLKLVAKRGTAPYTIYLVLDSPGGSISAGLDFIEFTKTIPNLETVTLFAASMASSIVEALPGRRNITENGILMFHRASGGVEGQFEDGELETRLSFYKTLVRGMEQKSADRMKLSLQNYKALVKDEMWILGRDSITRRAADEVVTASCTLELAEKKVEKEIQVFVFNIVLELNACPLIKSMNVKQPTEEKAKAFTKYLEKLNWRR